MIHLLKSYQKKLTNLSGNNRSLLLLRLSEEQDIDLLNLDFVKAGSAFSIIEKLLEGKTEVAVCPVMDSRNPKANEVSSRLKKISRREHYVFEERGARDLYLGWPFVEGKFNDGTLVRCPLLFFPMSLRAEEGEWLLTIRDNEEITFNKSFLLAYSHFNEIRLDDQLLDKTFDEFDKDSQVFRTELYQLLKESALEIHFNQDLFVNKLEYFLNYKRKELDDKCEKGILKLYSQAVLGLFPQSGSYLVPDFDHLIEENKFTDFEEFFSSKSLPTGDLRSSVKEEQTFSVFEQDASQELVLKEVKKGKSVVVEGPPGTGKSQLISNIIADFIARGKKVLVVCQKRAALDVVYERLKQKDVSDFLALVHDFRNDRKRLYDQIASQIDRLDEYQFKNNSLDSIFLEKKFVEVSRRIEQIVEELEEFKKALYDDSECGISPKELYLTTDPKERLADFKLEYRYFNAEGINRFSRTLKNLLPYAQKFERTDFIWRDRVSFSSFSASDKTKILNLLDHIPFFLTEISEKIESLVGSTMEIEEMEYLKDREEQVHQLLHLIEDPKVYSDFVFILNKNSDKDWFIIREKQILECFKGSGIEKSLSREQLGEFQKALEKAWQARRGLIKWVKWRLFSKDKYLIKRGFVANGLQWNRQGFEELMRLVDNRMNLEHNLTELRECGWLQNVPVEKDLKVISEWFHHQSVSLEAKELIKALRALKDYINIPSLTYKEFKEKLLVLLKVITQVIEGKKEWQNYLTSRQIQKVLSGFDFSIDLGEVVKKEFESIVHYDKILENLDPNEKQIWNKILSAINRYPIEKIPEVFVNTIKLEWLDSIEAKYPVLRMVSSFEMEQLEKELRECITEKLKLSSEILLMKVREMTYKEVEYNRLDNRVTYRDLHHQVTKKKKVWPLRKLIENFSKEIFHLVPCWLASPETVSSLFKMEADFDIVIFDEASQCYSERGIPAVCRGKQLVITGDSQQLTPSDIYQVRWEEEDSDQVELEVDSLLDLGKQYLPVVGLRGHYRSQSLELIEFSNQHFYKGRLECIPDSSVLASQNSPIRFMKVSGIWQHNKNQVEADTVIDLVSHIRKMKPEKSIGVVTFNYHQQNLILDKLEAAGIDPESLLVKNIENIQGDECDIIIFSLGYTPDATGKLSMQFGSLNFQGGEKRLNVAITRAREEIYIVSSILPSDMKVDDLKNEGPKLLKKYLVYAKDVAERKLVSISKEKQENAQWYLKNKVKDLKFSFNVSEEIPFSDLTISVHGTKNGLLLTDDNTYFRALSVKESHGYLPELLLKKGWKYKRIFSRLYWEDKELLVEGLEKTFGNHA